MPLPRVVLADLPPAEKERMLSFLVANKVDFKPDLSGKFTAVVKVVKETPVKEGRPNPPRQVTTSSKRRVPEKVKLDPAKMAGWEQSASSSASTSAREDNGHKPNLTAIQTEIRKRFPSFTSLLPSLTQHPKTMMKAELIGFMEEVYTARYNQDLLQVQQQAEAEANGGKNKKKLPSDLTSFPQSVVTSAGKRFGLRQMVGQTCWSLAKSVEQYRSEHQGIEMFARFLEESHDAVDVLFYLEMRWAARQIMMPRGNWCRAWAKTPKVFSPQPRLAQVEPQGAVSKTFPPSTRPELPLKKAMAAVREGIDPEAPEVLKASIISRLKEDAGDAAVITWDRFLFICTQEYRKARCISSQKKVLRKDSEAAEFARLIQETWEMSVEEAFSKFDQDNSGIVTYETFTQIANDELGFDASGLWQQLDPEQNGTIGIGEWELLNTLPSADPAQEELWPPGFSELSLEDREALMQEAQEVASRLAVSLSEHGENLSNQEVMGWALRTVLKRRGKLGPERSPSTPGLGRKKFEASHSYALSLDEMGQAWTELRQAQSGEGAEQSDLEGIVRDNLAAATDALVDEALQEVGVTDDGVKEALLEEFMVVTDALMEAVVTGDMARWLQQLNIESPGSEDLQQQFQDLTMSFENLLSATDEESVASVCRSVVAAHELRVMCCQRAQDLLEDTGVNPVPDTPDFAEADVAEAETAPEPLEAEESMAEADALEIEDAF
ncbi:unnamed protein product [Effrenium voratum]|uniref:EF-hand domain-containing protein n=1 Tax=Effrenium voratum TaxID=2562239 RepID=A0AA36NLD6_9DINO|nr:unnamed protein product [Effrenium voratum]